MYHGFTVATSVIRSTQGSSVSELIVIRALSVLTTMLPRLRSSANQAMWNAWHRGGLHSGMPSEVACIKNLIQVALPQVDAIWRDALNNVGLAARLQAVVCHGHPWVKYLRASARCELGDFLLVHDHQPNNAPL